jgi:transformation/transcription domain-associated protein
MTRWNLSAKVRQVIVRADPAEARFLYKTLLHTFRSLCTHTRRLEDPPPEPDGELLNKYFQHSIKCLDIYEANRDVKECKESVELIVNTLTLLSPHAFSSLWTDNMTFFIEHSLENASVFQVLQMLITNETVSHQLVAILLKHLMTRLDQVGHQDKIRAASTLKLFKMSFLAINTHIVSNEMILVPHLQKLIMDSFSHAAKSPDPMIYYQILRGLFR